MKNLVPSSLPSANLRALAAPTLAAFAFASGAVAQTVRYDTQGFEPGAFVTGPLAGHDLFGGQDGWLVTGDGGSTVDLSRITVQTSVVHGGTQAVEIDATGQALAYAHLRRNTQFNVPATEPVVEIAMKMRIASSATPTDAWGLQAQAGPGPGSGLFIWDVFPDDHVHMYDGVDFVDTGFVFSRDVWHDVVTYLDYQNKIVEVHVDGQVAGQVPALPAVDWGFFAFASIYFGLPGDDQMYMDDFRIRTIDQIGGGAVGTNYCQANVNSTGGAAAMSASGSASVASNDLVLRAEPVPSGQPGLFYFGDAQMNLAFGNGFRCVGGTTVRFGVQTAAGQAATLSVDLSALPGGAAIGAGDTRSFQYWFRDPAAGGSAFDLSDGLEIQFQP